jgi:hypothetical protein
MKLASPAVAANKLLRSLFDAVVQGISAIFRLVLRLVSLCLFMIAFAGGVQLVDAIINALNEPEGRVPPAVTATAPTPTTTLPTFVLRPQQPLPTVPSGPPPMDFRLSLPCPRHHPCQNVLYGVGDITSQTPAAFRAFLAAHPRARERTTGLVLNSQGGSLLAGLELGQAIRDAGWNTITGLTYPQTDGSHVTAVCYSSCAWAFAGGITRVMFTDGALGVHQFYGAGEAQITPDQASAGSQALTARINLYLDRMGVSRYLQDLASLTPSEQMRYLTQDEATSLWLTYRPPTQTTLRRRRSR